MQFHELVEEENSQYTNQRKGQAGLELVGIARMKEIDQIRCDKLGWSFSLQEQIVGQALSSIREIESFYLIPLVI